MVSNLNEHYSRQPEKDLFHYTTAVSFFNIIKSKKLWMTQIQYLNDSKEFRHGIELAIEELKSLKTKSPSHEDKLFDRLRKSMPSNGARSFIFSLSEKPDLLSQWRAYCVGGGFSVGFNPEKLKMLVNTQKMRLLPCIYNESLQRKLVKEVLLSCIKLYRETEFVSEDEFLNDVIHKKVYSELLLISTSIKHSAFEEEREWRIIGGPYPYNAELAGYRPCKNMIVPYYEFLLSLKGERIPISNIRVGPTILQDETRDALQWFMRSENVWGKESEFPIKNSNIPFRTFM